MNNKTKKIIFLSLNIILILLIFLFVIYLVFEKNFSGRIYPNVYCNDLNLSKLDENQAKNLLKSKVDEFETKGVKIKLNNREMIWYSSISSFDPDLSSQSLIFDVDKTIDKAYLVGRNGDFSDFLVKAKSIFFKTNIQLDFFVDENKLLEILKENFSDLENPVKNAELTFKEEGLANEEINISFFIEKESPGQEIDYDNFLLDFKNNINLLKNDDIELKLINKDPLIKVSDVSGLDVVAKSLLELAPFNLVYKNENKTFSVNVLDFASWFYFEPKVIENKIYNVEVGVDPEKVNKFFDEKIAPEINRELILPRFEFENNKVSLFEPGKDGLKLDYEKSFINIKNAFDVRKLNDIDLATEIDPIEKIDSINDLGIREIIGTGHSNFAGSPNNRRFNIKVGASKLHGLIIKPGDEFSLVKALGDVNKEAGYLPELVIKGNKTIPEYGGGLCQVATTVFRTALATGLPITERRNHSYRVSYYEPAGTDATIYIPNPDLKFKNDTGENILIQARFEGYNDIYFDFWGKSDGRISTTTYPVIYNIVKPGPTKIIETTELSPGEKKCTERAHSGAEAYFDYTVIYNPEDENENKVENRIYSKYVPWQEVCLIGVAPKEEEEDKDNSLEQNFDVIKDDSNKEEIIKVE